MEKLLSDIDMSRSLPVATFLELEAAARSGMCLFLTVFNVIFFIRPPQTPRSLPIRFFKKSI